jgi:hypothetical protein
VLLFLPSAWASLLWSFPNLSRRYCFVLISLSKFCSYSNSNIDLVQCLLMPCVRFIKLSHSVRNNTQNTTQLIIGTWEKLTITPVNARPELSETLERATTKAPLMPDSPMLGDPLTKCCLWIHIWLLQEKSDWWLILVSFNSYFIFL